MVKPPVPAQPEGQQKRHFPDWLKESLAIALVLLAGTGWLVIYYLPAKIDSQTKPMSDSLASLNSNVEHLTADVRRIDGKFDALVRECLKKLASKAASQRSKLSKQDLELAQLLVGTARRNDILLDPKSVSTVGQRLISIGAKRIAKSKSGVNKRADLSELAWQTTVGFIDYRSFFDAKLSPAPPIPGATTFKARSSDQVLVEVDPGAFVSDVMFEGGQAILHGGILRNIIFRDVLVRYTGGPISLENVHFENCRFEIPATPLGIRFGQELLASNAPPIQLP